jgi:hypothetical protein
VRRPPFATDVLAARDTVTGNGNAYGSRCGPTVPLVQTGVGPEVPA